MPKTKQNTRARTDKTNGRAESPASGVNSSVSAKAGIDELTANVPARADAGMRTDSTDRAVFWPGRTEKVPIKNDETAAYRFDLTITGLDHSMYVRRIPTGGTLHPLGGIVLTPGEEAECEITYFKAPGLASGPREFNLVLTRFDIRRAAALGEVIYTRPLLWVPLTKQEDLEVTAEPAEMSIRPWSQNTSYRVRFSNDSYLPVNIDLSLVRAESMESFAYEAELVGSIGYTLPAKSSHAWKCRLRPFSRRTSYFAAAVGTARAEDEEFQVYVAQPIRVTYLPWLKVWKDWALLGAYLLTLIWLAWGVPVLKGTAVHVPLAFGGGTDAALPPGVALKDLNANLAVQDANHNPVAVGRDQSIAGVPDTCLDAQGKIVPCFTFALPPRWYGFRGVVGSRVLWNDPSLSPLNLVLSLSAKPGKEDEFSQYQLDNIQYTPPAVSLDAGYAPTPQVSVTQSPQVFGDWSQTAPYTVPSALGVVVKAPLDGISPEDAAEGLVVTFTVDGQKLVPLLLPVSSDTDHKMLIICDLAQYVLSPLMSNLRDGKPHDVSVIASTSSVHSNLSEEPVELSSRPFVFPPLTFTRVATASGPVAAAPRAIAGTPAGTLLTQTSHIRLRVAPFTAYIYTNATRSRLAAKSQGPGIDLPVGEYWIEIRDEKNAGDLVALQHVQTAAGEAYNVATSAGEVGAYRLCLKALSASDTQSAAYLSSALALNPDSVDANTGLAYYSQSRGDLAQAIRFAKKAIEVDPHDSQAINVVNEAGKHAAR